MVDVTLNFGDGTLSAALPDSATVVEYGRTYHDPPRVDSVQATRDALEGPVGTKPLRELVGPRSKVAIAFPDRVKGGSHEGAHRKVALPLILRTLERAGVGAEGIELVCAIGLHRKNTWEEMRDYLPAEVIADFGGRIANHDAEDPDGVVDLGRTDHGDPVAFNATCANSDLCIVLGHVMGNPYGGYSGGYKTSTTGLTTWRSIAAHHTPATMHRSDFVPITPRSHFRSQLRDIGRRIEDQTGPMFVVDAVPGRTADVLGVYAGAPEEVEEASWPLAAQRTDVELDIEPADVVVFGLPRSFHYGPGMGTNPILMLQAISATVARCAGAFRDGGVAIVAAQCDGWFNEAWFPSYPETFELFRSVQAVGDLADYEARFAEHPPWVRAYRDEHAYHPFHAFSMCYMGDIARQRTSRIIVAGAERPEYADAMGLEAAPNVEAALDRARGELGVQPRVLALPGFLDGAPVHLHATRTA